MPIRFDQLSSAPARALQMYLVLIGCAANQQTITYTKLAERLGLLTPTWVFAPQAIWLSGAFMKVSRPSPRWLSLTIRECPALAILCRASPLRPNRTARGNSIGTPFCHRP